MCKKPVTLTKADLGITALTVTCSASPFSGACGCEECSGLGYSGRTAIGEILELTDEIKEMILSRKKPTSEIRKTAMEQGMLPIRKNGLNCVKAGVTSLEG